MMDELKYDLKQMDENYTTIHSDRKLSLQKRINDSDNKIAYIEHHLDILTPIVEKFTGST